jgi:hypothetical protein
LLIGGDNNVVDALVEFFDDVDSGVNRKFGVEDAALDAELLEEEFYTVAAVNVSDEYDDFALDQLELEYNIGQKKFLVLRASISWLLVQNYSSSLTGKVSAYLTTNWLTPAPWSSLSSSLSTTGLRQNNPFKVSTSAVRVALIKNV